MRPPYWNRARRELACRDPKLGAIIARYPGAALASRGDPFITLARSITGQQISVHAAEAVWQRLVARVPALTPAAFGRVRVATLRDCGLSARKVEYLKDLAGHFRAGKVRPASFGAMSDDDIIAELIAIRGIGRWTVEMFLIFNLLRPDVLPLDDIGLLKAVARHYLDDAPTKSLQTPAGRRRIERIADPWRPWRSVATWYLWRSLDPVPVEY